MMRSEKTLTLELQQFESKFETWNQVSNVENNSTSTKPVMSDKDVLKDLPPEVAAFDVKIILR